MKVLDIEHFTVHDMRRKARTHLAVLGVNRHDTFLAAYIALPQLQACAFVRMDPALSRAVGNIVTAVSIDDLLGSTSLRLDVVL